MKKNVAVIGCGYWGKNLVRNFYELGSLHSVCDPNTKLAQLYASQYNVKQYTFEEIINHSEIEGVVLAVPAPLHASMAIKSMNAGKNVFVEKPLAMNEDEAKKMIITAKKNNVHLMVGHLLQYHPVFAHMRKTIRSGDLGKLKYIYSNRLSFGKVRSEEDVIWSFAPHDLSMILSLSDSKPISVRTEATSILQKNISDIAKIYIDFKSGLKSHIFVSWLNPIKEQKLIVIGDDAMLVFDDTKNWNEKLCIFRHKIKFSEKIADLTKADPEYIKVDESEPLKNECSHFLKSLSEGHTPLTDGKEGMEVLQILNCASQSLESDTKIKI
jgi:predicted dehydrogenase